jgi:hypothetical protein
MLMPGLESQISGLIVSSSLSGRHVRRVATRGLLCVAHCIGYRQTKPHIGWMLFENDVKLSLI